MLIYAIEMIIIVIIIIIIIVIIIIIIIIDIIVWRQRGRVVRAPDLKSLGRGFKSRSDR